MGMETLCVRHIHAVRGKFHFRDILLKIAGVEPVDNVGIFLCISFSKVFYKFAFSDTGNPGYEKHRFF